MLVLVEHAQARPIVMKARRVEVSAIVVMPAGSVVADKARHVCSHRLARLVLQLRSMVVVLKSVVLPWVWVDRFGVRAVDV